MESTPEDLSVHGMIQHPNISKQITMGSSETAYFPVGERLACMRSRVVALRIFWVKYKPCFTDLESAVTVFLGGYKSWEVWWFTIQSWRETVPV